ncbi:hypothetical protein BWQ96_05581 [Gracilariopsis chorda]|uniref:Uncharacterized protein n=1 Tax=Gracilariopsis chorda TaxID=448386 RepID=A0A2V3IRB9_9FLOR|nr:hypothetical protein BWQ96_05581 [Gracilariopsis chorda]|eukprot:PXF44639.1 hypothetical protein BWQ96_05581 [Gracilariopsis chorda]
MNRCDAAFGLVKQRLKQFNVFSPRNIKKVIDKSFVSNSVFCATDIEWIDWKLNLRRYCTVSNHFKLSQFHVFKFSSTYKEGVMGKALSTDVNWTKYKLMKNRVTVQSVVNENVCLLRDPSVTLQITPLRFVPSAQEKTREAYLVKNVLGRYYNNDIKRRNEYFGSGSNWRNG